LPRSDAVGNIDEGRLSTRHSQFIPPMISRRDFIQRGGLFCAAGALGRAPGRRLAALGEAPRFEIRRLTAPPNHHFFGYYGMCPWNASGSQMVGLETTFHHRLPNEDEPATVGVIDPESGRFTPIAQTLAWNLQQGALLHWNPLQQETEVVFNDRDGREMKAAIVDVRTGRKRFLPRQISGIGVSGRYALSLSYGRVGRLRKVVGYAGAEDPNPDAPHPDNDGIFLMDLATGEAKLIVSIGEVFRRSVAAYPVLAQRHLWLDHTVFNDSVTRFLFLARSWDDRQRLDSAMFTANLDGSELRQVTPWGSGVSHFDWRTDRQIAATYTLPDKPGMMRHVLFTDGEQDHRALGSGLLDFDGHCTFTRDGRWMATDRKDIPELLQTLWLYEVDSGELVAVTGRPMKEKIFISGDTRCDFHPRWNRTSDRICFDAIDPATWTRQMHIVDLQF
jgi:hypothetical protein